MMGIALLLLLILSLLNLTITQGQGVELLGANPTASSASSDGNHEDAFEHAHEEGDEHVVNKEVCSSQDLPDETIAAYDRCTNFIPAYKKLNLLKRCREAVFPGGASSNFMRKQLCFNLTAEHEFNECMNHIKYTEGRAILAPNPLQTMDFMFCMKTIAIRRMRNSPSFKGCSVSVESGKTEQNLGPAEEDVR